MGATSLTLLLAGLTGLTGGPSLAASEAAEVAGPTAAVPGAELAVYDD